MKGICYVVGAGDCYLGQMTRKKEDLVIAVDGGYDSLKKRGIIPDLVMGDFDSIQEDTEGIPCIAANPVKDETDMLLALQKGKEKGYKTFYLYGGTGGDRISHTIANIQLLFYDPDMTCFLFDREEVIFGISDGMVSFSEECYGYLSVFSFSDESTGVTESGLQYEITDADLKSTFPIGVSNAFMQKKACVSVTKGSLVLVMEQKNLRHITIL